MASRGPPSCTSEETLGPNAKYTPQLQGAKRCSTRARACGRSLHDIWAFMGPAFWSLAAIDRGGTGAAVIQNVVRTRPNIRI